MGVHLHSAFPRTCTKRFDTHYYPNRPCFKLKPSQVPGKHTARLPVRCSKASILSLLS